MSTEPEKGYAITGGQLYGKRRRLAEERKRAEERGEPVMVVDPSDEHPPLVDLTSMFQLSAAQIERLSEAPRGTAAESESMRRVLERVRHV